MNTLEKRIILVTSLYTVAATLSKSFINVYLYEYTNSFVVMALYTLIRCGLFPLSDLLGTKLIRKHTYAFTIASGLIFVSISLIMALNLTSLFVINKFYVLLVAIVTGIGEGLYWFSVNSACQIISNPETRARFLSIKGIFGNIGSLLAPVISTVILEFSLNDMAGYRFILYFVFCLYVAITVVSLFIKKKDERGTNYNLKEIIFPKDEKWRNIILGIFFYGLSNAVTLNLTSIMIYNAAGSGGLYSKLLVVFSLIVIISLRFLPKSLAKKNIKKTFLISALLHVSSTLVLVLCENIYGAIYYGVTNALCAAFYDNSYSKVAMDTVSKYPDDITGRVVGEEFAIAGGRIVALSFIVLCYFVLGEPAYLKVAVVSFSFFPIFCYLTMSKNI